MKAIKIIGALALSLSIAATAGAAGSPINANRVTKRVSVNYVCQSNARTNIQYAFNAAGVPVTATARIDGRVRTLRYNLDKSDNVDTYFNDGMGNKIAAGNLNSSNVTRSSGINVFNSKDQIVYKSCSPR